MEKLLNTYMANPSNENRAKLFAYDNKHMMASCLLPMPMQVIFNQIKREAAAK